RAGHPWLPPHCADPGTGQVVWDESQRRGSHVRVIPRPARPVELRWPPRPAAVGPWPPSTTSPPAGRDWRHHRPPPRHPPVDGRGRAHRPDAAGSPNQCPQTTRRAWAAHGVLDAWRLARSGPLLSHLSQGFALSGDLPLVSLGPVRVLDARLSTRGIPRLS